MYKRQQQDKNGNKHNEKKNEQHKKREEKTVSLSELARETGAKASAAPAQAVSVRREDNQVTVDTRTVDMLSLIHIWHCGGQGHQPRGRCPHQDGCLEQGPQREPRFRKEETKNMPEFSEELASLADACLLYTSRCV